MSSLRALFQKIDNLLLQKKPVVIALDGRSGVGKSTLARKIAEKIEATIINCDDFYAGPPDGDEQNWHSKTPREKIDQVFSWQRMRDETIAPLISGKMASYHPFNFESGKGLSKKIIELNPAPVIILDGVYTAGKLKDLVDIAVLVEYPNEERRERLVKREGNEFMKDWHAKWDSAEDYYFNEMMEMNDFDFRIKGKFE